MSKAFNPTPQDLAEVKSLIESLFIDGIDEGDLAITSDKLAYQGFDPEVLLKVLAIRARTNKVTSEEHRRNLRTLALIGTMRGSKIETITHKSTDELKQFLSTTTRIYALKSGKPQTNNDATLLRIAAIFAGPLVTAIAANSITITTTINPESIAPGYPKFMCLSTFGALLPSLSDLKEGDGNILAGAFAEHQYQFDRVINSKSQNFSPIDTIRNFISIQQASALYSPDSRLTILTKINLIEAYGNTRQITSLYRPALVQAQQKWANRV